MSHPAKYRAKLRNSKGQAFQKLRQRQVQIDKVSEETLSKMKGLEIPVEKNMTEIRAKFLIREKLKEKQGDC